MQQALLSLVLTSFGRELLHVAAGLGLAVLLALAFAVSSLMAVFGAAAPGEPIADARTDEIPPAHSSGVDAKTPVRPSSTAAANASVALATVAVLTSAASSHLIALLAWWNRLVGSTGARLTSTSRMCLASCSSLAGYDASEPIA